VPRLVRVGALFTLMASTGCPGDDTEPSITVRDSGADSPLDTETAGDAPQDGPTCSVGLKPFFKDPGCNGQVAPICAASDDGCFGQEICLCDGRTSRKCTWSEAPFRHFGPCTDTDAPSDRPDDGAGPDAPAACSCGSGRTCPVDTIYASWCSVCQCRPNGQSICQTIGCSYPDSGVEPEATRCESSPSGCKGDCIYDQGCNSPSAYCSPTKCSNTFGGMFCGCDGVTFTSDCPRKPYRHVGACR
jgi:hypothetical protein